MGPADEVRPAERPARDEKETRARGGTGTAGPGKLQGVGTAPERVRRHRMESVVSRRRHFTFSLPRPA